MEEWTRFWKKWTRFWRKQIKFWKNAFALKTDNFLEEAGQFLEDFLQTNNADDPHSMCRKQSLSTTSIMDRQLLRQKVCQKISVIKTNTFVFVVFKTKRE